MRHPMLAIIVILSLTACGRASFTGKSSSKSSADNIPVVNPPAGPNNGDGTGVPTDKTPDVPKTNTTPETPNTDPSNPNNPNNPNVPCPTVAFQLGGSVFLAEQCPTKTNDPGNPKDPTDPKDPGNPTNPTDPGDPNDNGTPPGGGGGKDPGQNG